MKRKSVIIFLIIFTVLGFSFINAYATASKTADEALSWVQSQANQTVGSGQCVALIQEYYRQLGFYGVSGNGCDYATNEIPSGLGWREKNGVPQKGDILIYTGGYGHVAICGETSNISWHQNWGGQYVQRVDRNYNASFYSSYEGVTKYYWGCIHIDFKSDSTPSIKPPNVSVADGKTYISWADTGASSYNVRIKDKNGTSYDKWNVIETSIELVLPVQTYTVYIDNIFDSGYEASGTADFSVSQSYAGPSSSDIYANTSGNSVLLNWNRSDRATGYNVRIYDSAGKDYSLWQTENTYAEIVLPLGKYYAYVDSYNSVGVTKGIKISFVVSQSFLDIGKATPTVRVKNNLVQISWNKAKNANKYNVRISSKKGERFDYWNITGNDFSTNLDAGDYEVYIDAANDYGYCGGEKVNFQVAPFSTASTVTKKGSTYTITLASMYTFDKPNQVLIAGYRRGRLITLKTVADSQGSSLCTLTGDLDEIKVMAWDGFGKLTPITAAETIPARDWVTEQ